MVFLNNARRKRIRLVIKQLRGGDPNIDNIRFDLEDLLSEEEEAKENMPESKQDSDTYMIQEESCDYLQEAIDELDSVDEDDPDYADVISALENIDGV